MQSLIWPSVFLAKSEILENKLKRGNITKEELRQLAAFRVEHSAKPKREQWFIPCFEKLIEVPKDMYDRWLNQKQCIYV